MKKVLLTGAALMLVGGMASVDTCAAAEPGVKITGDARVRLFYQNDNYGDFGNVDADDSNTDMDSRVRLNITGTAAGGAYAAARIRMMENYMGDGDTDGGSIHRNNNDNIWVDKAYVGIPFTDAFTLEVGKYRSTYGPLGTTYNFFYDDVHLTGLKGIVKLDNVEINPFLEWMEEAQLDGTTIDRLEDNDEIRVGAHLKAKLNKDWTLGGMLGYQFDERQEVVNAFEANEGFFGSLYVNGKSGQFAIVGELAVTDNNLNNFNSWDDDSVSSSFSSYVINQAGTPLDPSDDFIDTVTTTVYNDRIGSDDTGFGGFIFPNYQIDKLNIGLNLGFTDGGFQPDRAFGFVMLGGTDNSRISAVRIGDTGDWIWGGLVASYQIDEALKLTGNIVYADIDGWDSKGINGDGPNTSGLGAALESAWELSAVLQYTISKGADVYFSAGYLKPEFENSLLEDDAAFGALTRFELKF